MSDYKGLRTLHALYALRPPATPTSLHFDIFYLFQPLVFNIIYPYYVMKKKLCLFSRFFLFH